MSTNWGYFCLDCQQESEKWLNHGQEFLKQFSIAHSLMLEFKLDLINITIDADYTGDIRIWLDEHPGHNLIVNLELMKGL